MPNTSTGPDAPATASRGIDLLGPPGAQGHRLRLALRPDLGGCVSGLWCGPHAVLRSTEPAALETVRQCASYPLVPFSNRVGDGRLSWAGQHYTLARNFEPEPHAIHGAGWQRPWTVVASSALSASLRYRHAPDASWPFAFEAEQHFEVGTHATRWTFHVRNDHDAPAPVGLGWHPYLNKRPGARLTARAQGRWEMDARKLPLHRVSHVGFDTVCDDLEVDHCFDGWDGVAGLHDGVLVTRLASDLRHLVVFTHPTRNFVAVEPVSHVNNALQLARDPEQPLAALGVRVLQPGERASAWLQIDTTVI